MFITMKLDDNYFIEAVQDLATIKINMYYSQEHIGEIHITTDHVDVTCVTYISISDKHINAQFNQHTLADVLFKLALKFPVLVRKPEFRFILDVPDNLQPLLPKYKFDNGAGSSTANEILIRKENVLPENKNCPEGIQFTNTIESEQLSALLTLLKNNAYWQENLSLERLQLLINNSTCFYASTLDGQLIGFARVLTNNASFASLWDVVVDKPYRNYGIATALMHQIFSSPLLNTVKDWVLFTDTAKPLYEKFGFVAECDIPERKMVHKLRLQDSPPAYMDKLIKTIQTGLPTSLNAQQTFNFLFGSEGKRANLPFFWKTITNNPIINEAENGKPYGY